MLRIAVTFLVFCAGLANAQPEFSDVEYLMEATLPDGRIVTTGMGEVGSTLLVGDDVLHENAQVDLIDAGHMGILVESSSLGNACPYYYLLIDKQTGRLVEISNDEEAPFVFARCEALLAVVPDANLILTWRYDPHAYAQAYIWNGYAMTKSTIPILHDGIPAPEGGDMVTRWDGVDPYELLKDPVEQLRLLQVLSGDEFDQLAWVMSMRSSAELNGDFLLAEGCVKNQCDTQNARIAIRISDGAPFVRIYDEGLVVLGVPDGEMFPDW